MTFKELKDGLSGEDMVSSATAAMREYKTLMTAKYGDNCMFAWIALPQIRELEALTEKLEEENRALRKKLEKKLEKVIGGTDE